MSLACVRRTVLCNSRVWVYMWGTGGGGGGGRVSLACATVTSATKASLLDMVRPGVSTSDGTAGGTGIVSLDGSLTGVWDSNHRLIMASHHPGVAVAVNTPVEWGLSRLGLGSTLWVEQGGVALIETSDQAAASPVLGLVKLGELVVAAGGKLSVGSSTKVETTTGNVTLQGTVTLGWSVTLQSADDLIVEVRVCRCVARLCAWRCLSSPLAGAVLCRAPSLARATRRSSLRLSLTSLAPRRTRRPTRHFHARQYRALEARCCTSSQRGVIGL